MNIGCGIHARRQKSDYGPRGRELVCPHLSGYNRLNIGAQTYTCIGLGDRVRVDKPTGSRRFVYDTQGRVLAEYGGSAGVVNAKFIWALPPETARACAKETRGNH